MNMFSSVDKILRPSYFRSHRLDKRATNYLEVQLLDTENLDILRNFSRSHRLIALLQAKFKKFAH